MSTAAASEDAIAPGETSDWWTPALEAAARAFPPDPPAPGFAGCHPFLAWLAQALGPAQVTATPAAQELLAALRAAGLVEAPDRPPLLLLGPGEGAGLNALALVQEPVASAAEGNPRIRIPGGLCLVAPRRGVPGAVGSLLRAAADPAEERRIGALFEALGDRLNLALKLEAAQRSATREVENLRRDVTRAEARAVQEAARRQAIEDSAPWRASRQVLAWVNARPGLSRVLRRGARLAWHRVIRPSLAQGGSSSPLLRAGVDAAISVAGVGTLVLAAGPGGAAVAGAALAEAGRRTECTAPPRAMSIGRIGRTGFAAFFPGDIPARATALMLRLADGTEVERPLPPRQTLAPLQAIRAALARMEPGEENAPALLRDQILPMVEGCWAMARQAPLAIKEVVIGLPLPQPEVSIVVPLYGRVDWILLQAALFSNDPALLAIAEVIYVIDDPDRVGEAMDLARIAHQTYGVPLRMLQLSRNCGYSGATNAGARAARGKRVLLMNSDVLPILPGWLNRLQDSFETIEGCGALGCRLLFDDGTLQHAGMTFTPFPQFDAWTCDHPLKGEPAEADPTTVARPVPAATGACLLVDLALYTALGGLSESYVIGDFEDADLCHRIAEAGRGVWYEPRVSLTHFERQSLVGIGTAEWRYALTLCNMMIHARRWGERLKAANALQGERD